jgi:hypothetical protein
MSAPRMISANHSAEQSTTPARYAHQRTRIPTGYTTAGDWQQQQQQRLDSHTCLSVRGCAVWLSIRHGNDRGLFVEQIQAMIKDWRAKFELPLPFLWVQISPWEGHEAATTSRQLPDMRLAQMAANKQPLTAVATAVDLGPPATANGWDSGDEHGKDPWGNVHFRNKGPLGPRLSAAAMNIVYGNHSVPYQGPLAETASAVLQDGAAAAIASASSCEARRAAAAVTVTFAKGTTGQGLEWVPRECPYLVLKERAHEKTENPDCRHSIDDCIKKCAWFDIELGKGQWVANATAAIVGTTITVTPPAHAESCALLEAEGAAPTGVRYLYGDWPVATLYSKVDDEAERLPALPFVLQL